VYVVVDDYTRAVYTRPLRLKSEAVDAFRPLREVAENESGKRLREVMTDNSREQSMGEMRDICQREGIKLNTAVPYHPTSNGVAERTRRPTNALRAILHESGLPNALWAEPVQHSYIRVQQDTKESTERAYPMGSSLLRKTRRRALACIRAPCAIVESKEELKRLDDRAAMCFCGVQVCRRRL